MTVKQKILARQAERMKELEEELPGAKRLQEKESGPR